jgi:hypothetical protein
MLTHCVTCVRSPISIQLIARLPGVHLLPWSWANGALLHHARLSVHMCRNICSTTSTGHMSPDSSIATLLLSPVR